LDISTDKVGEQIAALWGQDRLWLIARQIQSRLALNSEENTGENNRG